MYTLSGIAQGTTYLIRYSAVYPLLKKADIDSIFTKLDSSLSLYKPYSLINQFNSSSAGIHADEHFSNVIQKGLDISYQTKGAFDMTIKPLLELWGFHHSKQTRVPTANEILTTQTHVGYQKISRSSVYVKKADRLVQVDCDGIAQGYSVDIIASFLYNLGIHHYQIELGGEVFVSGKMSETERWKTGIDVLDDKGQSQEKTLLLENEAITTSGSFSKYSKIGNSYFGHIMDPAKGRPSDNGIISVSVIASDAATADALDNAFMVMGIEKSMQYLLDNKKIGLYIIYRTPNGSLKDTANAYFKSKISSSPEVSPHWR